MDVSTTSMSGFPLDTDAVRRRPKRVELVTTDAHGVRDDTAQTVVRFQHAQRSRRFEFLQRVVERRDAKFRRATFDSFDTIDEHGRRYALRAFGSRELTQTHRHFEHVAVQVILRFRVAVKHHVDRVRRHEIFVDDRRRRGDDFGDVFTRLHGRHALVQRHHRRAFVTFDFRVRVHAHDDVVAAFANRAHEVDMTEVKEVTDHGHVAAHVGGR